MNEVETFTDRQVIQRGDASELGVLAQPGVLERLEKLEGLVGALCREVGLVEVTDASERRPDPLAENRLGKGLGQFRKKVHALEEERRG